MKTQHLHHNNLPVTAKTKMADVIHLDYRLIPIIGRFGIDFGFGNKTVNEVCQEKTINTYFFLEIINSFHNQNYFPEQELLTFSVKLLVRYLSNTHTYYLDTKVPEIQAYIDKLEQTVNPENIQNIHLLNDFFKQYHEELKKHMLGEEELIHTYALEMENALLTNSAPPDLLKKIKSSPLIGCERDHEELEIKLDDLKNLIMKYLPPVICKELCQNLLTELFRLEADLDDHSRIEDKVLIPKVKLLEQEVLDACGSR